MERFYGACAAFYDDDYAAAGYDHDVPFYVDLAKEAAAEGGAVLELGCGTGRVLLPTARALAESAPESAVIVGVDASAGMLARLEARLAGESEAVRRRVRLVHGDITSVDVRHLSGSSAGNPKGGGFALVTAPFRVVHHLVEPGALRAWLRNVVRHLTSRGAPGGSPGGTLVFDVFQPDYATVSDPPSTSVDIERTDPETGRTVRRVSSTHHHPEEQTFEVEFEWLIEAADGGSGGEGEHGEDAEDAEDAGDAEAVEAGTTVLRWFTRHELELLLEIEGFEVTDTWGDFERTPYGEDAEAIVLRARPTR